MLCPDCPPARAARELVLADGPWPDVLYALVPFIVAALVAALVAYHLDRGPPS